MIYKFIFKRIFDIIFSISVMCILLPLYILISLLVFLNSGLPIFYIWKVVGKDGEYFKSYKFRTMINNADNMKDELLGSNEMEGPFFKMKDDPRITNIGKILRKYNLDELPQFFSVLKGDMSVVGPRPPLVSEWKNFSEFQKKKLQIKPGITCLWQVDGRNSISNPDSWIEKDLEYIDNVSFGMDINIIFKTIIRTFEGTGR
mgnify:FL=1